MTKQQKTILGVLLAVLACICLLFIPAVFFRFLSPGQAQKRAETAPATDTPAPRPAAVEGIAASAEDMVDLFEIRYGFENFRVNQPKTLIMADGPDGSWLQLELNPADDNDVVRVAALVRRDGVSEVRQQEYFDAMQEMLKLAAPDWQAGPQWLTDNWWKAEARAEHRSLQILYTGIEVEGRSSGSLEIWEE